MSGSSTWSFYGLESSDCEDLRGAIQDIISIEENWDTPQIRLILDIPSKAYFRASPEAPAPPRISTIYGDAPKGATAAQMLAPYLRAVAAESEALVTRFLTQSRDIELPQMPLDDIPEWSFKVQSQLLLPRDEGAHEERSESQHEESELPGKSLPWSLFFGRCLCTWH